MATSGRSTAQAPSPPVQAVLARRSQYAGLGPGLFIVADIASAHGGALTRQSSLWGSGNSKQTLLTGRTGEASTSHLRL
jgi:hypothetical protein